MPLEAPVTSATLSDPSMEASGVEMSLQGVDSAEGSGREQDEASNGAGQTTALSASAVPPWSSRLASSSTLRTTASRKCA